jgi:hypothetical protein
MRPSRGVATFALVVLVLLRGVGMAAEAWTACQVECCSGRHSMDETCCPHCPMHHKHHPGDTSNRVQSCRHDARHAVEAPLPTIALAPEPVDQPAAPVRAAPAPEPRAPEPRVVHPVTPPS